MSDQVAAFKWIGTSQFDDFWATLWQSPEGKHWARGYTPLVRWFQERLRARPFYVVTAWEPSVQRRHFAQMWGQVFERHYDNPAMHDLFWVHELAHWALVDFTPSASLQDWVTKWDTNEIRASFISEVLVHGETPKWDLAALGQPAWVRRFTPVWAGDPLDPSTWSEGATDAWNRRIAVRSGQVEPVDGTERWLTTFLPENARWATIWKREWRQVDEGLSVYAKAYQEHDECAMRRALDNAGQVHAWPTIPYDAQARAFATPAAS